MSKSDRIWSGILYACGIAAVILMVVMDPWPTNTNEQLPTATPSPVPTATCTPSPSATCTPTPTNTVTPTPTDEPDQESDLIAPTVEEVEHMAKVIHGEAEGCSALQKSGVAWCVCNRVDCPWYPDNVIDVITQPSQFHGYREDITPNAEDYEIAWDVLYRWLNGLDGRTLPIVYLYFHSNHNGKNIFTTEHRSGIEWDWSLPNIYEEDT